MANRTRLNVTSYYIACIVTTKLVLFDRIVNGIIDDNFGRICVTADTNEDKATLVTKTVTEIRVARAKMTTVTRKLGQ
jgi:hypothetical protein